MQQNLIWEFSEKKLGNSKLAGKECGNFTIFSGISSGPSLVTLGTWEKFCDIRCVRLSEFWNLVGFKIYMVSPKVPTVCKPESLPTLFLWINGSWSPSQLFTQSSRADGLTTTTFVWTTSSQTAATSSSAWEASSAGRGRNTPARDTFHGVFKFRLVQPSC